MKKIIILLTIVCASAIWSGCATAPVQATIKSESILIATVDTGMKIWADYVRAGRATQSQVDNVKRSYEGYYAAQMAAKAVIEKILSGVGSDPKDIATANAAVSAAESALLQLLNSYIK